MAIEIKVDLNGGGEVDKLSNSVDKTSESIKSLRQQFIDARKELMAMDESDPGFLKKAAEAGQLKDQISDMNAVIKATAGSTTENLGNALTGVASIGIGAFQGIASAQALLGTESEDLQKVLVKLQAAANMADAIRTFGQFGDTLTQIKASISAVYTSIVQMTVAKRAEAAATVTQTTATEGATVAQAGLNATMLANPIFLVIAAIGALVAAYYIFTDETDKAKESSDEFAESIKKSKESIDAYNSSLKEIKGIQNEINKSLSDEKVILAQDRLSDILRNRPNDYAAIKAAQANLNAAEIAAAEQRKKDQLDSFDFEAKLEDERRTTMLNQRSDLYSKIKKAETDGDTERVDRLQKLYDELGDEDDKLFYRAKTRIDRRTLLENNLNNEILKITKDNQNKIDEINKKAQEYNNKLIEQRIAKEDAQFLKMQELTLSETEFKKLQIQQVYDEDILKAEGNAELQKLLTAKLQKDLKSIDDKAKEESLKREKELIDKKKSLYDSYYQFLDSLETDPVVKRLQQLDNEVAKFDEALANKLISQEEYNQKVKERTEQTQLDIAEINKKAAETEKEALKKRNDEEINEQIAKYRKINEVVSYYLNGIQDITEVFQQISKNRLEEDTQNELSKYKEGTVEYENAKKRQLELQEEAAKKAFNINKAFQLAAAINDGTLAVLSTFAQTPGELIIKSAAAAVAGVFAAANIARIATSKYKGSSSGGSSGPSSVSTPNVSSTPSYNLFGGGNNMNTVNASTNQPINVNNQVMVKAVVSETEITGAQMRVNRYKTSSEL